MKKYLFVALLFFSACSSDKKIIDNNIYGKFTYISGTFSRIDYIMIDKKVNGKKSYSLTFDCNHWIRGRGYTFFLIKTVYTNIDKGYITYHLERDSTILSSLSLDIDPANNSTKMSEEEYFVLKTSYTKFSALTTKYSLSTDSLKSYFRWVKI